MDKKIWKKIARILKEVYQQLEIEALKGNIRLDSAEYDMLVVNARETVLRKFGYTLEQYQEAGEEVEKERRGERPSFEELKIAAEEYKNLPVLTRDEVREIAQETAHQVAKEYIKAPEIINKIVKEIKYQSPPQVIKETIHTTERVEYDDTQIQKEFKRLIQQIDEIKVAEPLDIPKLKAELHSDFSVFFEKNINTLDMPNFRKLAMGLQAQIDTISAGGTGGASTLAQVSTGSTDTAKSLYTMTSGVDVQYKTSGALTALYLKDNGNVGIGTTTPRQALEVMGTTGAYPAVSGTTQTGIMRLSSSPNTSVVLDFGSEVYSTGAGWLQATNAGDLTTNYPMLINPNGGNVGIGTTTPKLALHVFGQYGAPASSGTTPTGIAMFANQGANNLYFGANNTSPYGVWMQTSDATDLSLTYPLLLNPRGGNVGIGTTAPLNKLHVKVAADMNFRVRNNGQLQLFAANDGDTTYTPIEISGSTILLTNGNVGIGTTAPNGNGITTLATGNLIVMPGTTNQYSWWNTFNYGLGFPHSTNPDSYGPGALITAVPNGGYGADIQFVSQAPAGAGVTENMRITTDGKVGIGTTAPSEKLTVNGNILVLPSNIPTAIGDGGYSKDISQEFYAWNGGANTKHTYTHRVFNFPGYDNYWIDAHYVDGSYIWYSEKAGAGTWNTAFNAITSNAGYISANGAGGGFLMAGAWSVNNNGAGGASITAAGTGTTFVSGATTETPLSVRGVTSQTANLQEWKDVNHVVLSAMSATGSLGLGTNSPSNLLHLSKTDTQTSGTGAVGLSITPTYNQASGTAANTDLLINRTQTAVGSGAQNLIDTQVGGVSKFSVSNAGNVVFAGKVSSTKTSVTVAASATTFAVASNFVEVTGDAGANTVATITGGVSGQLLVLKFVDALVTITDTAAATADTINLSAAFTGAANTTLTLVYDGVKWLEVARSVNG